MIKRGRGRPKGSKNKAKINKEELKFTENNTIIPALFGTEEELKKEIRKLRKLKNQMKAGSKERIKYHRQWKRLKYELKVLRTVDPEKEPIVKEILKLEPDFIKLKINLYKFTESQLQKHLNIIKRKRGIE